MPTRKNTQQYGKGKGKRKQHRKGRKTKRSKTGGFLDRIFGLRDDENPFKQVVQDTDNALQMIEQRIQKFNTKYNEQKKKYDNENIKLQNITKELNVMKINKQKLMKVKQDLTNQNNLI